MRWRGLLRGGSISGLWASGLIETTVVLLRRNGSNCVRLREHALALLLQGMILIDKVINLDGSTNHHVDFMLSEWGRTWRAIGKNLINDVARSRVQLVIWIICFNREVGTVNQIEWLNTMGVGIIDEMVINLLWKLHNPCEERNSLFIVTGLFVKVDDVNCITFPDRLSRFTNGAKHLVCGIWNQSSSGGVDVEKDALWRNDVSLCILTRRRLQAQSLGANLTASWIIVMVELKRGTNETNVIGPNLRTSEVFGILTFDESYWFCCELILWCIVVV